MKRLLGIVAAAILAAALPAYGYWPEIASTWHEIQTSPYVGTSSNGQVLFNSSGSVAGDAGLTYDAATDTLTVGAGVGTTNSYAVNATAVTLASSLQLYGDGSSGAVDFRKDGIFRWSGTSSVFDVKDLVVGRVGPGMLGLWNEAAKSTFARVKLGGVAHTVGASTAMSGMIGNLFVDSTARTTAGTSEETLSSYTLPASALSSTMTGLRVTAFGSTASNANAKVVKLYFGSTVVGTATTSTSAAPWRIEATVLRTGPSTQSYGSSIVTSATTAAAGTSTQTDTSPILVKVTGETVSAAGDATHLGTTIETIHPLTSAIVALGDSKTADGVWTDTLVTNLTTATGHAWTLYNGGAANATLASTAPGIAGTLAVINPTEPVTHVLMNWGANDVVSLPAEATWETDYETIIDAVHAKWPLATIYLSRPWRQTYDTESTTLVTWIGTVQAARSTFTVLADDENVWFKPNVATHSDDGIHWNVVGNAAKATATQTAMGY